MRLTPTAALLIAFLLGVLYGFFLVFAGVFTDGPTSLADPERLTSLGLVAAAYGLTAFALGRFASRRSLWHAGVLCAPAFGMLAMYVAGERAFGLAPVYFAVAFGFATAGMLLGLRLRARAQSS